MIHVAYRLWGGDGFYAKMLGTSMLSMFENTKEKVTIHIMHNDRLTPDNRGKFCYIAGQYNQQVEFHNVEKIAGSTLRKFEAAYPIESEVNAMWYPLITHEVFPDLDKIILIGADTVFNEIDIGELWKIELNEEFPFAAVAEFTKWPEAYGAKLCYDGLVKHKDYFNGDLFLVKPFFFKENFELILDGLKFLRTHGYTLAEQDCLNYLFSTKYQKLPNKFNYVFNWDRRFGSKPLHLEKAIYHYAGGNICKPSFDTDDIYYRLYWEYFLKTPWANVDMFGNLEKALNKKFKQLNTDFKNNLLHFTNLLAHRKRAFLVDHSNIEATRKIFEVKEDELIIDVSEAGSSEKFFKELAKRDKVFFLLLNDYWLMYSILKSQNFVDGTDFVNGIIFLSEQYGINVNFDTKPIVQEL